MSNPRVVVRSERRWEGSLWCVLRALQVIRKVLSKLRASQLAKAANQARVIDVGYPSECCEYVLLPLIVNKETDLAISQVE